MPDGKSIAIVVVVALLLGAFTIGVSSCVGSGDTYYHIPDTDTRKSKTVKPKSGWSVPKVTTRKR